MQLPAFKKLRSHCSIVSVSNPDISAEGRIIVIPPGEKEAEILYSQDFENITKDAPEFDFSIVGSTTRVEIEDGSLRIRDNDPQGKGIFTLYFPPQRDTTTISFKIRLDRVDVKEKGTSKAQGSYVYVVMGGKEGLLSSSEEMFRIRNASTYRAGSLSEHRWVLSHEYKTPELNPELSCLSWGGDRNQHYTTPDVRCRFQTT